eukprot:5912487-Alexandrium_andersonii.AAC.1
MCATWKRVALPRRFETRTRNAPRGAAESWVYRDTSERNCPTMLRLFARSRRTQEGPSAVQPRGAAVKRQ